MKSNTGAAGEEAASAYLQSGGYTVVARNFRTREGEVDIVAQKDGLIAFVEVKARRSDAFGTPAEAVTQAKRRKICRAAAKYIVDNGLHEIRISFDVIEVYFGIKGVVRLNHIAGAFDYEI